MALEPIRPKDLPPAVTVFATDSIPVDNGASVGRGTPVQIADAGAPIASEAEAIAGVNAVKRMTPLTTRQVLDNEIAPSIALALAWAESPTPPDPLDITSKSAKTWAGEAAGYATQAALYDGIWLDDVAALRTNATLTYANTAVGKYIRTRKEGFSYQVASSGASDHHVTMAGGVKLYVNANNGALPAGAFDDAPQNDKTYLYGPDFVTVGDELYNWPADDYQRVIGQEYLAAFTKLAVAGSQFRVATWGDSRVEGIGVSGDFIWATALRNAAQQRGYFRGSFVNEGLSGRTIQNWTDSHLDTYLDGTDDPDLAIFSCGINDMYIPFGGAGPELIIQRMDSFLEKIRITKGYAIDDMAVVITVPPSAYNPSDGRDPRYIEPLRDGFRRLARKWQVCFVDSYAVAADGRNQRGLGYAADITAPEVIHQNNTGMTPILAQLIDAVLPDLTPMSGGGLRMESGYSKVAVASDLPAAYPVGVSYFRASPGGGGSNWPLDGMVCTEVFPDDIIVQTVYEIGAFETSVYMRKGRSNAWGPFVQRSGVDARPVTPGGGFTAPIVAPLRTIKQGHLVVIDGYLDITTPGALGSGLLIGTIDVGSRPTVTLWGVTVAAYNGADWVYPRAKIETNGEIRLIEAVGTSRSRIDINSISWACA